MISVSLTLQQFEKVFGEVGTPPSPPGTNEPTPLGRQWRGKCSGNRLIPTNPATTDFGAQK